MKSRLVSVSLLAVLLLAGTVPVQASSIPIIQGQVSTIELCPQTICQVAVFTGLFVGRVGFNPSAVGLISVTANHEPLPTTPLVPVDITGGDWSLRLLSGRRVTGFVDEGSTLTLVGTDLYAVHVEMVLDGGGTGNLTFDGFLSHQVFPPQLFGDINQ
ncbi:MAG TPA: hypothetical protein VF424_15870 [Vicinamibacterales bacterium]